MMETPGIKKTLENFFEDTATIKTGVYLKAVIKFLMKYGISIEGTINDLGIMFLILNPFKSETDIFEISRDVLGTEIKELSFEYNKDGQDEEDKQMSIAFESIGSEEEKDDLHIDKSSKYVEPQYNR